MAGGVQASTRSIEMYDDFISQMDIESYVETRVRPLVAYFERRGPIVSRRNTLCESMSLLANTAGAVLSVLGLGSWISATVAVAATFLALQDYFYVPSQLEASNRTLQECHNLLNWWESLSLVQRKARAVKLHCALTAEGAVLAITSARTAMSPALPSQQEETSEEE